MHAGPARPRAPTPGTLALIVAVIAVYATNLGGEWLNWDDRELLADPMLTQGALDALYTAFTTTLDRAWYPLTRLLYAVLSGMGWLTPAGLHLVDLGLFLASIVGLVTLLPRLGVPRSWVVPGVALWALHPHRVESVAWAASTKDVLSLALAVAAGLALWPCASGRSRPWLGHAAWAGALLAKSAVFPVAAIYWAIDASARGVRPATRRFGGLLALAVVNAVAARWAFDQGAVPDWPSELPAWALPAYSYGVWTSGILVPTRLAAIYPFPASPWPWVALGAVAIVGPCWVSARIGRRAAPWLAAWLLHPLPVMGMVPLAFWAADRYTLVISLAPALLIAGGLEGLQRWHPRAPGAVTVVLAGLLAVASANRAADWTTSLALWTTDVGRPGEHFARHQNLGWALGAAADHAAAAEQLRRAEALAPDRLDVRAQRIVTELYERGRATPAAIEALMPPPMDAEGWAWATQQLVASGSPDHASEALATAASLGAPEWVVDGLGARIREMPP